MRLSRALLALTALAALAGPARAANEPPAAQDYTLCAFYPQAASCNAVYQHALTDTNPASGAVRDAFRFYGRYLQTPSSGLSDQDKAYLKDNAIALPYDGGNGNLNPVNLSGLHNVINDPALAGDASARRQAVTNFVSRALQAELFCGLSKCDPQTGKPSGA